MGLSLRLSPRKIALALGAVAVLLALQSLYAEYVVTQILDSRTNNTPGAVLDVFSVNLEESLPTWFSSINLFLAACLLGWIALIKRTSHEPHSRYWLALALIFLYLSADEGAALHETLSNPMQRLFNSGGFLHFGWLIVGIPAVILFGLAFFRFWLRLPEPTRRLFAVSGILYVGGAVVIEAISARQYEIDGGASFLYLSIATVEELCEMLGVVLFIYTLLDYLTRRDARIVFETQTPAPEFRRGGLRWPLSWPVTLIGLVAILLALDGGLLVWSRSIGEAPPSVTAAAPYHFYILVEELADEQTSITHFSGVFDPNDTLSQRTAAALLAEFPAVQILSLPALNASIAVASETPVLTHETIIELMDWIDETEYVFFDTPLLRAAVEMPAAP